MAQHPGHAYGQSRNLFVFRKGSDSIIVGGVTGVDSRWTRVLSQRAVQMLWFHLTQFLYPDKAETVTAQIMTAPLRRPDLPTITTHTTIDKYADGRYEITGWVGSQTWSATLDETEAHRFWTALDSALTPQPGSHPPVPPTG